MRPKFCPESTARLKQAYDLLERVYSDESHNEPGLHMNWLSEASSKVHFVMQSTSTQPEAKLPADHVRVIQREEVVR